MATADVVSSDIVGYGYYQVPAGYSIFSPVFKSVSGENFDLNDITPTTTNRVALTGNAKVTVFKLTTTGAYGTSYAWYPAVGWSADGGTTGVSDGVVTFTSGEGFAMSSTYKELNGVESTNKKAVAAPMAMLVSGEVDLVCKNAVPYGYSISGNATPLPLDLNDITPITTNSVALTGNAKVTVFKLGTAGTYETSYAWYPSVGWSADGGATGLANGIVTFTAGEGFALSSTYKELNGVESTNKKAVGAPLLLQLKKPL